MKTYQDIDGDSGVTAYECGQDWIRIRFNSGAIYEYRASKIGERHLSQMKQLADSGNGLNAYINIHPKIKKGGSKKSKRQPFF